ncbi:MAG: hypothetical protein PCFJNLEI_00670 [Verrucomicrobiae bacterium]|nr:hypothetical protein [Verrucomicrobiae bacterium]
MNENKNTSLRIPDPAGFDPKADASDWPIQRSGQTDVKAVQIIGARRLPRSKETKENEP